MFNSTFNLKIYSLKIIIFFIYISILLNAFYAEPKDKHPRTTPKELQFSGGCFRRDKNEKSQCANNSANICDNLCFHNLKITVWLWKIHIWIVDCVPESAGCYNNRFCIYAHSDTPKKAERFHLLTAWSREEIINLNISVPPEVFGKFLILLFCHCCLNWKFIVWKFIVKFDENLPTVPRLHPCREILFSLLLSLFRNTWKFGILICHWKIHPLHPKIHLVCNCFDTDVS